VQIPSSRDVPASINRGVPIVIEDPKHAVSVSIRQFAEQNIAALVPTNENQIPAELRTDRRGFLRRKAKTS